MRHLTYIDTVSAGVHVLLACGLGRVRRVRVHHLFVICQDLGCLCTYRGDVVEETVIVVKPSLGSYYEVGGEEKVQLTLFHNITAENVY